MSRFSRYYRLYCKRKGDDDMEQFDFKPYKIAVLERMENNLETMPNSRIYQLCLLAVEEFLRKELNAEVAELDAICDRYQQCYNIIGSVGKAFYEDTANGRQYRYLYLERAILHFEGKTLRFMDWLLEHQCYMNFSEMLPEYLEYLHTQNLYHLIITKITKEVERKLQTT